MTTEARTIQVQAYRCPDGKPTCSTERGGEYGGQSCPMRSSRNWGVLPDLTQFCAWTNADLQRDSAGYLRPCDGCLVWGG